MRSYPLASFGHIQNFERTPPDKYVQWMNVTHVLVCDVSSSLAVCPVIMRSTSCMYPLMSVPPELRVTGQVREFPGQVPRAHSVIAQRTLCLFLIRYIFVLSVIHLLHVR